MGGGAGYDDAVDVEIDASGNAYILGTFSREASFGSTTLISAGEGDIFVAAYDTDGSVLWAAAANGWPKRISVEDRVGDLAVDTAGNVFVAGAFNETIAFGSTAFTGAGTFDAFLAQYRPGDSWVWAASGGGSGYDEYTAVTMDASGNLYAVGLFSGTATFGSVTLTNTGSEGDMLW